MFAKSMIIHDLKLEEIGKGDDSRVYLIKDKGIVLKVYSSLQDKLPQQEALELIIRYYEDTERADELLKENPNPYQYTVRINHQKYSFNNIIVPQGGVCINEEGIVCSIGQEYISGKNLSDLFGKFSIEEKEVPIEDLADGSEYPFFLNKDVYHYIELDFVTLSNIKYLFN